MFRKILFHFYFFVFLDGFVGLVRIPSAAGLGEIIRGCAAAFSLVVLLAPLVLIFELYIRSPLFGVLFITNQFPEVFDTVDGLHVDAPHLPSLAAPIFIVPAVYNTQTFHKLIPGEVVKEITWYIFAVARVRQSIFFTPHDVHKHKNQNLIIN